MLDIFISHSARDAALAEALIQPLRAALSIPAERIRCTSVDGYRLPVGATTEERLRKEVHDARSFIGLITKDSLQSAYVLFELGARWGAGRPLAPVLAAGTPPSALGGPLSGLNALSCDSSAQVHQLVADVASELGMTPGIPSSYQRQIEELLRASQDRVRTDAPLVAIFDPFMTGQMIHEPSGSRRSFLLIPVTVINEGTRTITPEYFSLSAVVQTRAVHFIQTTIPAGVEWASQTQHINIPHAADYDLAARTSSLLPGEAATGFLMFSSPEVDIDTLQRAHQSGALNPGLTMSCTDVRGLTHTVLTMRQPSNVPGPIAKLGVSVAPKQ